MESGLVWLFESLLFEYNEEMRVAKFIVLFLSIMLGSFALAKITQSECSTIDYSSRFVPPKNQGNAGFCYSFAASDLVSEAASIKPPDTASAFYAGAQYISMTPAEVQAGNDAISFDNPKKQLSSPPMGAMGGSFGGEGGLENYRAHDVRGVPLLKREGGNTDLIAAHLIDQGHVCLEKDVRSEIMGEKYKDTDVQNFFMHQLATMAGGEELEAVVHNKKLYSQLQTTCMLHPPLEGLNQLRPLKGAMNDWAANKLREQVDQACKTEVPLKNLKVHSRSFTTQDKNPESVGYMMSVLDQGRPFALHCDFSLLRKWPEGKSSWHATIVTGRRWNDKKQTCEIAIKNSWGDDCEGALEPGTCDKGRWWLDTEKLANAKSEVIWIDRNVKSK